MSRWRRLRKAILASGAAACVPTSSAASTSLRRSTSCAGHRSSEEAPGRPKRTGPSGSRTSSSRWLCGLTLLATAEHFKVNVVVYHVVGDKRTVQAYRPRSRRRRRPSQPSSSGSRRANSRPRRRTCPATGFQRFDLQPPAALSASQAALVPAPVPED
eukprot:7704060-Alexandrium_andersonii.AAC.1